jgi:hypothetical protein
VLSWKLSVGVKNFHFFPGLENVVFSGKGTQEIGTVLFPLAIGAPWGTTEVSGSLSPCEPAPVTLAWVPCASSEWRRSGSGGCEKEGTEKWPLDSSKPLSPASRVGLLSGF